MLKVIVCMDRNGAIGNEGELVYRLKDDLANFKNLTTKNTIVYGRKTLQSMGGKPLPNRNNIIMSRDKKWLSEMEEKYSNVMYAGFKNVVAFSLLTDVYICGGGEIYEKFITEHGECIDQYIITVVDDDMEQADTWFPIDEVDLDNYDIIKHITVEEIDKPSYTIYTYQRRNCDICE